MFFVFIRKKVNLSSFSSLGFQYLRNLYNACPALPYSFICILSLLHCYHVFLYADNKIFNNLITCAYSFYCVSSRNSHNDSAWLSVDNFFSCYFGCACIGVWPIVPVLFLRIVSLYELICFIYLKFSDSMYT